MKKFVLFTFLLLTLSLCFAQEKKAEPKKSSHLWSFSLTTDFAYSPKSDYVKGKDHFAPVTAAYSSIGVRMTGKASQSIPIPFGTSDLVKGNTLDFTYGLELSPLTIMPTFDVSFTPIAFLVFSAGANIGTGWFLPGLNLQGIARLVDPNKAEMTEAYESLSSFNNYYLDTYLGATFQFDVAALWPGDWHHIVSMANFTGHYTAMTGVPNGEIWAWQGSGNQANGWNYKAQFVLGYQMPLPLAMIALNTELSGHFNGNDYDSTKYPNYNGSFMSVDFVPFLAFAFGEKHSLLLACYVSSRRSFSSSHDHPNIEPLLNYSGKEWFFKQLALSYTVKF